MQSPRRVPPVALARRSARLALFVLVPTGVAVWLSLPSVRTPVAPGASEAVALGTLGVLALAVATDVAVARPPLGGVRAGVVALSGVALVATGIALAVGHPDFGGTSLAAPVRTLAAAVALVSGTGVLAGAVADVAARRVPAVPGPVVDVPLLVPVGALVGALFLPVAFLARPLADALLVGAVPSAGVVAFVGAWRAGRVEGRRRRARTLAALGAVLVVVGLGGVGGHWCGGVVDPPPGTFRVAYEGGPNELLWGTEHYWCVVSPDRSLLAAGAALLAAGPALEWRTWR